MVPWHFLLPGLCWSGLRLPEEGSGDGGGDCNGNLQGKFPGKIEDSIGLPDIPAGRKMPGFAVCRDLADSPGNLWMSYNSVHCKKVSEKLVYICLRLKIDDIRDNKHIEGICFFVLPD